MYVIGAEQVVAIFMLSLGQGDQWAGVHGGSVTGQSGDLKSCLVNYMNFL